MTLRQKLTGPEHDEIGTLLHTILEDVREGRRTIDDAVGGLRQAFAAALAQNVNVMNELRTAARA